ncbi:MULTISPECIES: M3 family oligoendopeptidase [Shouchella]|uniref:Oligoendopeptidase F n=2 Tax=Shouchella TaxID=2893057 RepID=A0A268P151_SHOCL|nr:M3 family oligoendopeptidase [Shouchella clausii]PAE89428.1 oligoendopeptidase F [Shouchella clausii]PAE94725.1 oligoendopeptidase F [Shouchella clausii]
MGKFYQEQLDFSDTKSIEQAFTKLLAVSLDTREGLERFMEEESVLLDQLEEAITGHYIDFNCHNGSEEAKRAFEYDQQVIEPLMKRYEAKLDEAFLAAPALAHLPEEKYGLFVKRKRNAQQLYREENVKLEIEEASLATAYFEHTGSMTVDWDGQELTIPQLSPYFQNENRETRKKAMSLAREALLKIEEPLQEIFSKLMVIRQQKAENAGLANYRDYMFKKYARFDYTPEDCKQLALSIAKHVKPLKEKLQRKHADQLGVDTYRPWDVEAVIPGQQPLKPFEGAAELIEKAGTALDALDARFGGLLRRMDGEGMLDLESRKGKSPGGFCAPLPISKLSFIFMNHANTHDDMITLFHEMGHCIHNDLKKEWPLSLYRDTPMESSELASMSMELMTMDQWSLFYSEEDLKRAKYKQLKGIVDFLPAGIVIDQFQHWLYEHPSHSEEERNQKYRELLETIDANVSDWSGYEKWRESSWIRVLHIFEVPFYYVEYVIAQLGALQLYKNYKQEPEQTLARYKEALALGSSKSLHEVYSAAGVRFDFSAEMIGDLMAFVEQELNELV